MNVRPLSACAIVILLSVLMPVMANAKWSKASSKFTYNGVSVEVVDMRNQIGKVHHNTAGYTIFENRNKDVVTVNWKCYGVLRKGGGEVLVKMNENTFTLSPRQVRNELYSYGAGRFQEKDFEKYVISIEVLKGNAYIEPTTEMSDNNSDKVYDRLSKQIKSGNFTQDEYSEAIDWLTYTFDTKMAPAYKRCVELARNDNKAEANRITDELTELGEKWNTLGNFVLKADKAGKLNDANHQKLAALEKKVKSTMK